MSTVGDVRSGCQDDVSGDATQLMTECPSGTLKVKFSSFVGSSKCFTYSLSDFNMRLVSVAEIVVSFCFKGISSSTRMVRTPAWCWMLNGGFFQPLPLTN